MRKFQPIEVVIHMPEDIKSFEGIYIEATFAAIKQIIETAPKEV